jgi:hypothetical protein
MSLLPNQTNVNQDTYFFLLVDAKVINTSTINANTGTYDKLFVNSISTGSILVDSISTLTASISSINTNNISSGTGYISSFKADNIIVSSLIGQTASISSIFVNNISSGSITTGSINGNSNFSASNWYLYPAQGTVTATLNPFDAPQYDLSGFRNIYCRELNTTQNVNCGNTVNALVGTIGAINCPDILMSPGDKVASLNCYGTDLVAGDNALFVEGGTTLTGGGVIHGVTIGALRDPFVTGLDLVRIDVLPAGMDLVSATFITIDAAGAANVAAGGALSLAGGSYIEYNSDQHYFINTSGIGNDFTDIFVGNIHGASNGSASLRINEGRGVELSNVKSLYLQNGQSSFISGSPSTVMTVGAISSISISTNVVIGDFVVGLKKLTGISTLTQDIQLYSAIPLPWDNTFTYDPPIPGLTDPRAGRAEYLGNTYDCVVRNLNVNPSINIPNWLNTETYYPNNYAFVPGAGTYKCVVFDLPNPLPPNNRPSKWVLFDPSNSISIIWTLNNSIVESGITGDEYSYIRVGSAYFNTLNTSNLTVNGLSTIAISTNSIVANKIVGLSTLTVPSTFTQDIQLNSSIPLPWNNLTPYSVGDKAEVNDYYVALVDNLNLEPTQPIPLWNNTLPYYPNNYAFVTSVGAYKCIAYQPPPVPFPPNGNPDAWVAFNPSDSITNVWTVNNTAINSGLSGDKFSYIRVGSGYFDNLITSTINVSSITATNISSITAESITTEFLKVSVINSITTGITENITINANQQLILGSETDTNISGTENITLSSSNINLIATDFINSQGEWNFGDYNLSNIGHLSAVSTSIGFISTGTLTADTIYSYSTLTSTITANNIFVKGTEDTNIQFFKPSDQEFPIGAIGGSDDFGFYIASLSSILIQAVQDLGLVGTSNLLLGSQSTIISATDKIIINTPEIEILNNATISSINTHFISTSEIYTDSIFGVNNLTASNTKTTNISSFEIYTVSIFTENIGNRITTTQVPITVNNSFDMAGSDIFGVDELSASFFTGLSISTNNLSTGSLLVNNYIGNSISTNRISTGNLFSGVISSIQFNASSINANRAFINNLTGSGSAVITQNLYPQSAGSVVGYGSNTAQGGFYGEGHFRSTFTNVILPALDAGAFSNNIRIQGNVSTQNVFVSTINRKLYPYTSTFGILNSASTFRFTGTTATTPQIMYSNITFPHVGTYIVQGKNTISKASGGGGAEAYGYFSLSRGLYPSTFNTQDAFNSVPFMGVNNVSTFNTFTSELYVSSMNTNTRFITYADQTGHNYTLNFALGQLRATYIPSQGINPE